MLLIHSGPRDAFIYADSVDGAVTTYVYHFYTLLFK